MNSRIFLFSLFFGLTLTVQSQRAPKLNVTGDVVVHGVKITLNKDACTKTFEITAPSDGNYHINFWLLPERFDDGSFSTYEVQVGQDIVGEIRPNRDGWQSVSLHTKTTVPLRKGKNQISISCPPPEIPEIEFVRLSKNLERASISPSSYQKYIRLAKNGERVSLTAVSQTTKNSIKNSSQVFHDVPVRYSVLKYFYFTKGQKVNISSESLTKHIVDVYRFKSNDSYQVQSLNWLRTSEFLSGGSEVYKTRMQIEIPVSGRYCIKIRSAENGTQGVVNFSVNGKNVKNVPIFYASVPIKYPKDQCYVTMTRSPDDALDPYLFMEGAWSTPGRIVGFNDSAPDELRIRYGLKRQDACLLEHFLCPVSGVHITNYSSNSPVGTCSVIGQLWLNNPSDGATRNCMEEVLEEENLPKTKPMEEAMTKSLLIEDGYRYVEIYNLNTGEFISRQVLSKAEELTPSKLGLKEGGSYILRFIGDNQIHTRSLIVKR